MSFLKDKKVLMFAPKFFGYENDIKEEMERQGGEVHLYDERGNPSTFEKIIIRKFPKILKNKIYKYYESIVENERNFYPEYIFFLSPETATIDCIKLLKHQFPRSTFILYMYDSIDNKNAKNIYKFFDKCFSFDQNDCEKFGFIFRPLFYVKSFEGTQNSIYKYDFCFIGSIHSDRAKILYELKKQFDKNHFSYFYYLYIPGKLMLFLRTLLSKYVRKLKKQYIFTEAISKNEIAKISDSSKVIIDINHPKQIGLTIRTIEMLGLKKKILTTNKNITNYDFYKPENQIVISRTNICVPKEEITGKYESVEENIYKRYCIQEWIKEIFEG